MTRTAVVLAIVATFSACERNNPNEEPGSEGTRGDPSLRGRPAEQPGQPRPVPGQGTPADQAAGWRGDAAAGTTSPPATAVVPAPPEQQGSRGASSGGDGGTRR